MTVPTPECFTDFALQEYAQRRLDPAVRAEVDTHIAACAECRAALEAFEAEARLLRGALRTSSAETDQPVITDEYLALYSGGALPPPEAEKLESLLSRNPGLLERLVALARETAATQSGNIAETTGVSIPRPLGEILRMPKRISPPKTVGLERKASGGH